MGNYKLSLIEFQCFEAIDDYVKDGRPSFYSDPLQP